MSCEVPNLYANGDGREDTFRVILMRKDGDNHDSMKMLQIFFLSSLISFARKNKMFPFQRNIIILQQMFYNNFLKSFKFYRQIKISFEFSDILSL